LQFPPLGNTGDEHYDWKFQVQIDGQADTDIQRAPARYSGQPEPPIAKAGAIFWFSHNRAVPNNSFGVKIIESPLPASPLEMLRYLQPAHL
jgi:hypothetical protein